jgi:UDP-3-O-[3-hydroxymyristoyl] N-acetylglucosamine deacetylase
LDRKAGLQPASAVEGGEKLQQHGSTPGKGILSGILHQRTLKSPIGCTGIGLHSGENMSMTLSPAAPGTGIIFRRTDITGKNNEIAASWRNVVDTRMATTVANDDGVKLATIEHLMAAFAGCAIDNVLVEIDGPEVPIMDGSAAPFVFLIECAGIIEQAAKRRAIRILRLIEIRDHAKSITITPATGFSITFEIDFDHSTLAQQHLGIDFINGNFKTDIARARTFGFEHEVTQLREAGLALGGSLDNAVVISGDKVLNGDGLRYGDEFVRHKILDCIGDLYLAGGPIMGHVQAMRSGHTLNHRLLGALFEAPDAWCYTDRPADTRPMMGDHWDDDARVATA